VFQVQRERPTRLAYSLPFRSEERRPASVVLDEPDDTRFKTEGVSDRLAQREGRRCAANSDPLASGGPARSIRVG